MTTPSPSDSGSPLLDTLPCPHCAEPMRIQIRLRSLPFRCPKCRGYSAFPFESRVQSAFILIVVGLATVLLSKLFALDKASTFPGIAAWMGVLVGGLLVGSRLVVRSLRATATHLVKSRRPLWFW